jgi:hypothetical protein
VWTSGAGAAIQPDEAEGNREEMNGFLIYIGR